MRFVGADVLDGPQKNSLLIKINFCMQNCNSHHIRLPRWGSSAMGGERGLWPSIPTEPPLRHAKRAIHSLIP